MTRRYAAELIGTFGIVFAPVALSASAHAAGGDTSLAAAAWVSGISVLAMIYAVGHISAAHFNPAVTLGFAVTRRFPWRYVPAYWISQVCGAIVAAGLSRFLFGVASGAHVPTVDPLRAIVLEAAITALLMFVIISVATDRRVDGAVPGIAIGLTVVLGVWIAGAVTGGSMNPARSLGPALLAGGPALAALWIYFVGPMTGSILGALAYEAIRGGEEHARGAPNELFLALTEIAEQT